MSAFFWTSGHLGWGFFALLVFSVLWFLLTDFFWRKRKRHIAWFLVEMAAGWLAGVLLLVLAFHGLAAS